MITQSSRRAGFIAVTRRFPGHELAIRKLMRDSEGFSELCDDLAEAEEALSRVDVTAPEDWRERRRKEWVELVESLVREVADALGRKAP